MIPEQSYLEAKKLIAEYESEQLNNPVVCDNILMNILEDNYDLNKQFHEEVRDMIYSFATANYDEKLTLEEWLYKYYR